MKNKLLFTLIIMAVGTVSFIYPQADFNNGEMGIYVNQYGRVRIYDSADSMMVDRLSILVSGATNEVFDYKTDAENATAISELTNPTLGAYESNVTTNNAYSGAPPDVTIDQSQIMWDTGGYALIRFGVLNNESSALSARLGLEIIPTIYNSYDKNIVNYDATTKIVSFTAIDTSFEVGIKFLNQSLIRLHSVNDYENYGPSDEQFYTLMTTAGFTVPDTATGGDPTLVTVVSTGTINIASGASEVLYIGVAVGKDSTEMVANMAALEDTAYLDISPYETGLVPEFISLAQNYPNPFNPETSIEFAMDKADNINLTVFNLLGKQVATLANGHYDKGIHNVKFSGNHLTSGVYFYTLETSDQSLTRKMILMK